MEQILFFFVSFLALASAFFFVFAKNAMYAILSLIVTFFSIAALYILLNAKTKMITFNNTVKPFLVKFLNTILMGIGMYLLFRMFDFKLDTSRTMYIVVLTVLTSGYGVLSYWIGSRVFKIEEVYIFEKWIKKMWVKIFKGKENEESI